MTARVLPMEEWHRLDESLDPILAELRPGGSRIVVIEHDGAIVGRVLLFPVLHAECLWIDPVHRKRAGVLRRLLRSMYAAANDLGFSCVWGASDSSEMTGILAHPSLGGTPIPALSVVLPVKGY